MGKRVLIVEHSFGDRMILRDSVASLGYKVVGEAKSIRESLEKYDQLKPDLVLLDAAIPDIDGASATMQLLRLDGNANILIFATRGQRALAMESLQMGAKDFIVKPFTSRVLHRTIRMLIG
jgi:two-component system chemotaxis response regulator CheY